MRDFLGNELEVGDRVVMTAPQYRMFVVGEIIKMTAKKVRVKYMNTWNFSKPGRPAEYLTDPDFLLKVVDEQYVMAKLQELPRTDML